VRTAKTIEQFYQAFDFLHKKTLPATLAGFLAKAMRGYLNL
jgi:hypothetical protein